MQLMQASRQWANRPADERFTSLIELNNFCTASKNYSRSGVVPSRKLECIPLSEDKEHKGLMVVGPGGNAVAPTHWAFGQLASRAGAPPSYLRELPAPLAADCINYGMRCTREVEDIGVLLYKNGGAPELRAVTGPQYGRVWNATITQALVDRFGDGISGDFKVPGEFGKDVTVTKANTTLYASDRDMFVFLADEKRRITLPNRRDGKAGSLARGFFVWNSEVGKTSYGIAMFLFDFVCCNRIVWGAEGLIEIRGRHTASAPEKWLQDIEPAILTYAEASALPIEAKLLSAQKKKLDDVNAFLLKRFSRGQAEAIQSVHLTEEARPIETLWDATTAITAYARGINNQDTRIEFEREAGKILEMA